MDDGKKAESTMAMSPDLSLASFTHEQLLGELEAREVGRKSIPAMREFGDREIFEALDLQLKAIYGPDDRREVEEIADAQQRVRAESTVSLFLAADVQDNQDGTSTLLTEPFAQKYSLCSDEPFGAQPIGAFCSGFLVAGDLIATAGHCIATPDLPVEQVRFVFGFRRDGGAFRTRIPNGDIYRAQEVVGRQLNGATEDWAVIRLDRVVSNRAPLKVRKSGKIADGSLLYVVGHPCGLPAKHAGNARVRENSKQHFFVANLDTYGGNSGSAVFGAGTHEVEGILVRGETDFIKVENCWKSKRCADTACRGEDCQRTSTFAHLIP